MREVPRPAFPFAGLWFQAGKTQIHLNLEAPGFGPAGNLLPAELRHPRTQHVAFEVADAEAVVPLLKEQGVPMVSGLMVRPDGWRQVFVTDPDGHVIELCSPPKSS
jgi:catechol 2,3-dioxygenase-like lactoylglutathione lyase family enzyme